MKNKLESACDDKSKKVLTDFFFFFHIVVYFVARSKLERGFAIEN